ncbi:hypothetical protein DB88DRAFT_489337 [Papiliotrema laurentii]|uniref:NAD(P)-binding domain-containing protein n=1 Tax=Papiliotrema laurentii TaxID=5418 RepID=A0AAD9D0Y8_PAPLA|nr:hypothetical protein DB88DRAFT_489337 [Papiliotrema laurentii]
MLSRRLASTVAASGSNASSRKIVLVGTGFLASYIVRSLVADPRNRVLLVSRNPQTLYNKVSSLGSQILPPQSCDITSPNTASLQKALEGADAVVSMVGLLVANEQKMIDVQQKGAERVAKVAKEQGVGRVVMVSAIGADPGGVTPYQRTKAAAEEAFLRENPQSTIIRPSIIFGPGDSFFTRFATLAKYLPFLPVFGGGVVRFQPVYAGDVARAIEICCRDDPKVVDLVGGKIIEAGGPDVFTYKEIMQLVLKYSGLQGRRLILSLPYWVGMVQGFFLEKLPESIFTVTRDQIKQLRSDNVVTISSPTPLNSVDFEQLLAAFPSSLPTSAPPGDAGLTSVYKSLPTYLGPKKAPESGKRTHGRGVEDTLEEVRRMSNAGKKTP